MRPYATQSTIVAKLTTMLVALVVAGTADAQPPTHGAKRSLSVSVSEYRY